MDDTGLLRRELAEIDGWYEQAGDLGRAFRKALAATGVPEMTVDRPHDMYANAHFQMSHDEKTGFQQAIHYLPSALMNREEFFGVRTHEGTHAIQAFRAACLHAHPAAGSDYKIFLRPRDMVWAWELMEKDAIAKTTMMHVQFAAGKQGTPPPPDLNPDNTDLRRKIIQTTDSMLAATMAAGSPVSVKEYYNRVALQSHEAYAGMLMELRDKTGARSATQLMKKHGFPVPVYVRLEPQDIADIGSSFGPDLFACGAAGKEFSALALSPHMEAAVKSLNERLEIEDEESLPTFGAALAARGLDRREFLRLCRA